PSDSGEGGVEKGWEPEPSATPALVGLGPWRAKRHQGNASSAAGSARIEQSTLRALRRTEATIACASTPPRPDYSTGTNHQDDDGLQPRMEPLSSYHSLPHFHPLVVCALNDDYSTPTIILLRRQMMDIPVRLGRRRGGKGLGARAERDAG